MDELPLAIIFIHPWEFGLKDFRMLTAEQHVRLSISLPVSSQLTSLTVPSRRT